MAAICYSMKCLFRSFLRSGVLSFRLLCCVFLIYWLFLLVFCILLRDSVTVDIDLIIHCSLGLCIFATMNCVSCNNLIAETQQSYNLSDLGVELTVVLEEQLHSEVDHEGVLCNSCFDIAVSRLSRPGIPRPSRCVWCLDPIIGRHTHSLPEGLEREYIAHRILPRQVQPQSKVCYACWLAACRNVQRQHQQATSSDMLHNEDHRIDVVESRPSTSNEMANCIWCEYSISGRHSHSLPEGVEREIIAASILPREIGSSSRVCYACWMAARRLSTQSAPPPTVCMLPNYRKAGNSSNRCFVIGCARPERHRIPLFLKIKLLKVYKLYLPNNARICNEHLGLYDWDLLQEQIYGQRFSSMEIEDIINLAFRNEENNLLDFENIERMSNELCHYWTGLSIEKFYRILEQTPSLREQIKDYKTALGLYLVKLRTGEPNSRIAQLFMKSESYVSKLLRKTRQILTEQFVPLHLGVEHLPRAEIVNHNLIIPEGLFGGEQGGRRKAIVICDGTYVYLQKSSNYLFQKKSYSLHKYRNLVKPFLIVTTDGHILDIYGPYPATVSDAEIMKELFRNEGNELRQYFREGDVFILDRGFRDSIDLLTSLNYRVCKPESLVSGETQMATLRANQSRLVTMCRWVVEVVNGRFKRDFKLIRNDFSNNVATHLMMDFRIAGAIINAFHMPITDRPDANVILDRALQKLNEENILSDYIILNNMNRRSATFRNIDADVSLLEEFPVMTMSDLILLALGTYQIKQARSYYGEHIRENGSFNIEICDAEPIHISNIIAEELKLIRGRIKSRHRSSKIYNTYILLNMEHSDWEHRLQSFYCSCIVGKRTVGCCAHIMTIIWYMGWARHQETITAPATLLDSVLVRDDIENEGNE